LDVTVQHRARRRCATIAFRCWRCSPAFSRLTNRHALAGYYDLSHFDREFIALTGHNPTDHLRLRRRFRSENPGHAFDVGPLPTD
jgi:AraC-like DNA-binding protein